MWDRSNKMQEIWIKRLKSLEENLHNFEESLIKDNKILPSELEKLKPNILIVKNNLDTLRNQVEEQRKLEEDYIKREEDNTTIFYTIIVDDFINDINNIYDDIKKQAKYISDYEEKFAKWKMT